MKRLFLDTNIILDLLGDRKPFSKFAVDIFSKAEDKKLEIYVSSHSIATSYYILKKQLDEKKLKNIISELLDYVNIIPITENILRRGLKSNVRDFEDSLQIFAALSVANIDYIITRNVRDFKESEIPVLNSDEVLNCL